MEQFEKMLKYSRISLASIAEINPQIIALGKFSRAYGNMDEKLGLHFKIGLLHWRQGLSPRDDMEAVLATAEDLLVAAKTWKIDDTTLAAYGDVWDRVRYVSFLLDRQFAIPTDFFEQIRRVRSQYADVAVGYHLLDLIEGQSWDKNLEIGFTRLAEKRRQSLAVDTYRTYFDLLDAEGDEGRIESLVRAAEANYKKRARDAFYAGGPTYLGGGPDNSYVVDFVLAAVLKKIGWTGETIHKWIWDLAISS